MVLYPELTKSRRLARHIQGLVDKWEEKEHGLTKIFYKKADMILNLQDSIIILLTIVQGFLVLWSAVAISWTRWTEPNLIHILKIEESVDVDKWIWDWEDYKNDTEKYLVIESDTMAPSQTHLYLETQTAMCTETQKNVFDIHASTQSASSIQHMASTLLGVSDSHVTVKNNLIGGGFGGKEPQSIPVAAAASFACAATGRQVRVINDRQIDMKMIGKRHTMIGRYRACIDKDTAMIVAMDRFSTVMQVHLKVLAGLFLNLLASCQMTHTESKTSCVVRPHISQTS